MRRGRVATRVAALDADRRRMLVAEGRSVLDAMRARKRAGELRVSEPSDPALEQFIAKLDTDSMCLIASGRARPSDFPPAIRADVVRFFPHRVGVACQLN